MLEIVVVGKSDSKRAALLSEVHAAVGYLRVKAKVATAETGFGATLFPALVIDGKLVCEGGVVPAYRVMTFITNRLLELEEN